MPEVCYLRYRYARSSPPDVFLEKDMLKIYCKFTGEHTCRCVISIKLLCNTVTSGTINFPVKTCKRFSCMILMPLVLITQKWGSPLKFSLINVNKSVKKPRIWAHLPSKQLIKNLVFVLRNLPCLVSLIPVESLVLHL